MKLLTTNQEIEEELIRLMKEYNEYHWAIAWAGTPTKCFNLLNN